MATWKSRTSRRWEAWRWAWPRPSPIAARWTSGSASAWLAWARISSFPTFCAATSCSPRYFPMISKYPLFDRSRLQVKPLAERVSDLDSTHWLGLDEIAAPYTHPDIGRSEERRVGKEGRSRG